MDIGTKLDEVMAQDEQPITRTINQKNGDPYLAADGSEATMTFRGQESEKVRKAKSQNKRNMIRQMRAGADTDAPEHENKERVNVVFNALVAWHGWELNGSPAALTLENVRMICRAEHILTQAEAAIRAHSDFFKENSGT